MRTPDKIYSVSEINQLIKTFLELNFTGIALSGEISNFKAHSSGHFYFSLKDQTSQIQVALFRGSQRSYPFEIKDGLEVIVRGRLTLYEPRGQYQFVADSIEPKGIGAWQLAFNQLKEKLSAEGLFDPQRKKRLPFLPRKIGIVTSPTGAVIRDLLQVLTRRFPNIHVILAPVAVQGEKAPREITKAIQALNQKADIDLLIVGRGGGSIEDLWAFNTEEVVRAIANSSVPIISAVGHEIDITLADYAADLRAPTPSAAAELAVPVQAELRFTVDEWQRRLIQGMQKKLARHQERLIELRERLRVPQRQQEQYYQRLDELQERLQRAEKQLLDSYQKKIFHLHKTLNALSPLAVLKRGYSIAYLKGSTAPLKRFDEATKGSSVVLQLSDGQLETKVMEVSASQEF